MQLSLRLLLLERTDHRRLSLSCQLDHTRTAWRPVAPDGPDGGRPAGQRLNLLGRLNDATLFPTTRTGKIFANRLPGDPGDHLVPRFQLWPISRRSFHVWCVRRVLVAIFISYYANESRVITLSTGNTAITTKPYSLPQALRNWDLAVLYECNFFVYTFIHLISVLFVELFLCWSHSYSRGCVCDYGVDLRFESWCQLQCSLFNGLQNELY